MYRGVLPFIALQISVLALTMVFPQLVTWLPTKMLGFK
jgi:TRAP-type mannitol/chloroaromatic compound transport system permease large subunit